MLSPDDLIDKRYRILSPLGQGGMAYVFKANDEHLNRNVALKLLRPHLTETDQERFRREIRTLASLNHPSIATIYDLGTAEHIYFTMELVEGGLFTDLGPFENEATSMQTFIQAAIAVTEALSYVHSLGIVHRDLTPRNILLNQQRHPKVMDFGLVQLAESTRELTRTGLTLGTPQYMAPEQAKGELTGAQTDLYTFGAVLYKAATGQNPFEAENDQAVLYQHVYNDPKQAQEINPAIPKALASLIHNLLAKNPDERPSSSLVVKERLQSILYNELPKISQQRLASSTQSAYYPTGPGKDLELLWEQKLPEGPQWPATLAAGQGFLFLGLRSEELQVRHPADGSLLNSFESEDEINVSPLLHENRLFSISRDGNLSALTWPNGQEDWQADIQAIGMTPYGNDLIISSYDNHLEKRQADGLSIWKYLTESPVVSPVIIHKLLAFCTTQEGWVHAVNATDGTGKYKIQVGDMSATPSAHKGILFLPERSGALHAFKLETKEVLWTFDLESQLWASPIAWENRIYTVAWDGNLYCLEAQTGNEIWAQPLNSNVTATPIIAASILYLVTEQGDLLAFNALNGKQLVNIKVANAAIQASPLIIGQTLIIAALDGTLKAFTS